MFEVLLAGLLVYWENCRRCVVYTSVWLNKFDVSYLERERESSKVVRIAGCLYVNRKSTEELPNFDLINKFLKCYIFEFYKIKLGTISLALL